MQSFITTAPAGAAPCDRQGAGLAPWQARRILDHITENLDTTTRVADLAAVARLSVSHFARACRLTFDVPPAALVRRQRLERARHMMLTSQLPLCEIAIACGFSDQAHMSRLFRRHLDSPPARWRASMRCVPEQSAATRPQ